MELDGTLDDSNGQECSDKRILEVAKDFDIIGMGLLYSLTQETNGFILVVN